MDMDHGLLRHRDVEQGIAAGGHLAQARADDQQQVGVAHALGQLRIDADADVAGIAGLRDCRTRSWQRKDAPTGRPLASAKAVMSAAGLGTPAAAAHDHQRALGRGEQLAQPRHVGRARDGPRSAGRARRRPSRPHRSACLRAEPAPPARAGPRWRDGRPGSPARECAGRRRSPPPIW